MVKLGQFFFVQNKDFNFDIVNKSNVYFFGFYVELIRDVKIRDGINNDFRY